jgi:hypothetical protein
VDPFALIMLGIVALLVLWVLFLGRYHPRSSSDILDWKPTRSPELEAQNEVDDLEQMLEATNERRRRRGEAELTEEALEERVRSDRRQQRELQDRYLEEERGAGEDLAQMLARVNDGRRRRGEPELTADEYRARLEADRARFESER